MTVLSPIPVALVASINEYVRQERDDVARYDNREHLDSSGVWSLHDLARRIYAVGWSDGYFASVEGERGMRP